MAKKVFQEETLVLQNGEEITIKPLNIKYLRRFMNVIERLNTPEKDEEGNPVEPTEMEMFEMMIEAAQIAVSQFDSELAEDEERFEDAFDIPTIERVLEVAGGIKVTADPNQLTTPASPGQS